MTLKDEIFDAMVNGATPIFLIGMIALASRPETRETLVEAIMEVQTDLTGDKFNEKA